MRFRFVQRKKEKNDKLNKLAWGIVMELFTIMSVPFVWLTACLFGVSFVDAKHGDLLNFTQVQLATKGDMDSFLSNVREQFRSNFFGASVMKKVNANSEFGGDTLQPNLNL